MVGSYAQKEHSDELLSSALVVSSKVNILLQLHVSSVLWIFETSAIRASRWVAHWGQWMKMPMPLNKMKIVRQRGIEDLIIDVIAPRYNQIQSFKSASETDYHPHPTPVTLL